MPKNEEWLERQLDQANKEAENLAEWKKEAVRDYFNQKNKSCEGFSLDSTQSERKPLK